MTKLLVQGDDYGFTKAVTLGIIEGIDNGILRNTGMFTNMPTAVLAAELMKGREDKACFGIDFNLVSGPSVCDPKEIPHLVDEEGQFIRSGVRIRDPRWQTVEGRAELFPYDEVEKEIYAQYNKFVELTGRQPGYFHGHSISSEAYRAAINKLSAETGIPFSSNIREQFDFADFRKFRQPESAKKSASFTKTFDPIAQLEKNTLQTVLDNADIILAHEYAMIGGHPGYIDADLLGLTTLSLERCKDLQMIVSPEMKKFIADNNIELITYYDLVKDLKAREGK